MLNYHNKNIELDFLNNRLERELYSVKNYTVTLVIILGLAPSNARLLDYNDDNCSKQERAVYRKTRRKTQMGFQMWRRE